MLARRVAASLTLLGGLLGASLVAGCEATMPLPDETGGEEVGFRDEEVTAAKRREYAQRIKAAAEARGLHNGWLLAGIANAETNLSHCWSEQTWACKGPASADCGGGPVIAGSGDGPCYKKQGGLGMFQFDAGTYSQTLAREGNGILTVDGNIDAAIDFVLEMVKDSKYVDGVETDQQALAWLDGVVLGGARYDDWLTTVTHYYNGCSPAGCGIFDSRYDHYDDNTRAVWDELGGGAFWRPTDPIGIHWARGADGSYSLRASAGPDVVRVEYVVEGYEIGDVPRDDPDTAEVESDFPARYTFNVEKYKRRFEALGYDAEGALVARGVGLIDSVPGFAVFIRQQGAGEYEVGVERAASSVTGLELTADGVSVIDGESGQKRSPRLAVRHTYSKLGARNFTLTLFDAAGAKKGTYYRSFTLE